MTCRRSREKPSQGLCSIVSCTMVELVGNLSRDIGRIIPLFNGWEMVIFASIVTLVSSARRNASGFAAS